VSRVPFAQIADDARLWIFAAANPLASSHRDLLRAQTGDFVEDWLAHGRPVVGAYDLRYDHFLLVAADEAATGVSGCSIDSLFRVLKQAEAEADTSLLDSSRVWFRDEAGEVQSVSRQEFRKLAEAGEVSGDTVVFDNTISTVGDLRAGMWEGPARQSWHGRAFSLT
jgi:hypothetical protein